MFEHRCRWFYNPYITHFSQPDTIVPDPYNPLDWNRYAYARYNPIRYTDPTGHCTGDPDDPNNQDKACWKKLEGIENTYDVFVDSEFDLDKLKIIESALAYALKAFNGNMNAFSAALGKFSINFNHWVDRAVTPPGAQEINLGLSTFVDASGSPQTDATQIILHEIGHIFDFHGAGLNSNKYKSTKNFLQFNNSNSFCMLGLLGCINSSAPSIYRTINGLTGGNEGWNSQGSTSSYGQSSSIDDFAEAFAFYAMSVNGASANFSIDPNREGVMSSLISGFVSSNP